MAIEFDIKVVRPIALPILLGRVASHLRDFGVLDLPSMEDASSAQWGDAEHEGVLSVGDVIASLIIHKAGEESELGEDGGFWVTVSAARSRTGAGVFLASVVAVAVAEATGSSVVDEARLLQSGRRIEPSEGLRQLRRLVGHGNLGILGGRMAIASGLARSI